MSETPDEEVDYGSSGSIANPLTDSDHAWSTSEIEIFLYSMLQDSHFESITISVPTLILS